MAVFRREGRSRKWRRINKEIRAQIKKNKKEYAELKIEEGRRNSKAFYRMVKQFSSKAQIKRWDVPELYPGLSNAEVADKATEYYGTISDLLPPLRLNGLPKSTEVGTFEKLTEANVMLRIANAKKPTLWLRETFSLIYITRIWVDLLLH